MLKKTFIALSYICVLAAPVLLPADLNAGVLDRLSSWWSERSVAPLSSSQDAAVSQDATEAPLVEEKPAVTGSSGMCQVPREPERIICETGTGLCVNTPPGGVASDSFIIYGTVDKKGLANLNIALQNEYTKRSVNVDTSKSEDGDCWSKNYQPNPFCLSADGKFSAKIPLTEKGPHSISVTATRATGASLEKRVRVSRVVALKFDDNSVSYSPDIKTDKSVDHEHVSVTADILGDCKFCDFIGASTGGVKITVDNTIEDALGATRRISCSTTVEQGGSGKFVVGVPVGSGRNIISVRACNAATGDKNCPKINEISFEGVIERTVFKIISPSPEPSYDAAKFPEINWAFELGSSDKCYTLKFNREAPREICPAGKGKFEVNLAPRVGINVATLSPKDGAEEFGWTFGWGQTISPFASGNGRIKIPNAVGVSLPASTITGKMLPLVNKFLSSDEFVKTIADTLSVKEENSNQSDAANVSIPKCKESGGGISSAIVKLRGKPKIGKIEIKNFVLGDNKADFSVVIKNLKLGLNLALDENKDGKGDKDPLPLTITMRKALLDLSFILKKDKNGQLLALLSSLHNDCDFKRDYYCRNMPAPLLPKNIAGSEIAGDGFIKCEEEMAKEEAADACEAINTINAQTGAVTEMVLDFINDGIYCSGSKAVTGVLRSNSLTKHVAIGCKDVNDCSGAINRFLPPIDFPLSIDVADGLGIAPAGVSLNADVAVGDGDLFASLPSMYKVESAGIVVGDSFGSRLNSKFGSGTSDLEVGLSLDLVNALLFGAIAHGDGRSIRGVLDFDITEDFFNTMGFDFIKECDEFEAPIGSDVPESQKKPPSMCFVRPTVGVMLGASLTSYGYFDSKQPIMLSVRGNRALGARVSLRTADELPIITAGNKTAVASTGGDSVNEQITGNLLELELAGIELSMYALEIDDSIPADWAGNLKVRKDEKGRPVIHSMNPADADPWNGQIVSFDLTLLLAIELGNIEQDPADAEKYSMLIRPLANRSRIAIVPIDGKNSTLVPASGMINMLNEEANIMLAESSSKEKAFRIPLPKEIALASAEDSESLLSRLGLQKISFADGGISLSYDSNLNAVYLAIKAAITEMAALEKNLVE